MPNTLFPVYPTDAMYINEKIAVKIIEYIVYYFNGDIPFYQHEAGNYHLIYPEDKRSWGIMQARQETTGVSGLVQRISVLCEIQK